MRLNRDNYPIVAIHDVADAYGFVAAQVMRAPGVPVIRDTDEAEELIAEGVTILFELADRFEPHRPGYDQPGRFSGYAAWALPKRLQTAWRRMHPEHRTRKLPDGRRTIEYGERPLSLLRKTAGHDREGEALVDIVRATSCLPGQSAGDLLDQAVITATASAPHASAVVYHLSTGARTDTEIATSLGETRSVITQTRACLAVAIRHHEQQAA